jgi:DNA (cytosine-5)-methyltransferase 1
MYTLTKNDVHAVAVTEPVPYDLFQITAPVNRQNRNCGDPCHTLAKDNAAHAAIVHTEDRMVVRRLTPCECERLQGFPDQYTQIPWRKKPAEDCPDGHRYRALGNSMAVPVMRWIGERIATVDRIACVPSNERTES